MAPKVSILFRKPRIKLGIKARILRRGPKAVLFDMDGVVINSIEAWRMTFNDTLVRFGSMPISKSVYEKSYGNIGSVKSVIRAFREDFENPRFNEDAVKYCNQRFDEMIKKVKLFPSAKRVLKSVKRKFKTALITNTERQTVFKILKKFGIEKYFDVIVTIDDVKNGKPNPEIVLKACKALRVKVKKAVVVGDTNADKEIGRKAGCKVIGVLMDADERIEKISELPKKLGLKG